MEPWRKARIDDVLSIARNFTAPSELTEITVIIEQVTQDRQAAISDALFDKLLGWSTYEKMHYVKEKKDPITAAKFDMIILLLELGVTLTTEQTNKFLENFLVIVKKRKEVKLERPIGVKDYSNEFLIKSNAARDALERYERAISSLAHTFTLDQIKKFWGFVDSRDKINFIRAWAEKALPSTEFIVFFCHELSKIIQQSEDSKERVEIYNLEQKLKAMVKKPALPITIKPDDILLKPRKRALR